MPAYTEKDVNDIKRIVSKSDLDVKVTFNTPWHVTIHGLRTVQMWSTGKIFTPYFEHYAGQHRFGVGVAHQCRIALSIIRIAEKKEKLKNKKVNLQVNPVDQDQLKSLREGRQNKESLFFHILLLTVTFFVILAIKHT